MNKPISIIALVAVLSMVSLPSAAVQLAVGGSDNIQKVLAGLQGQRATVKLESGDELTGTIKVVNAHVVQVAQLSGKEFYDAVVAISSVAAVIVRTKN